MGKRSETIRAYSKELAAARAALAEQLKAVDGNLMLSDAGKESKRAALRADAATKLFASASASWKAAAGLRQEAAAELGKVRVGQQRQWDYARLQFLQSEIASRLGAAGAGGPLGPNQVQQIAALREQFVASQDSHGLRALRVVVRPLLEAIRPSTGDEWTMASTLRGALRSDEAAEVPAELAGLESEARALESEAKRLRYEVLETERAATGQGASDAGVFGLSNSPWRHLILGEGATTRSDEEIRAGVTAAAAGGRGPFARPVPGDSAA